MPRYVALLRGVSPMNAKMPELKAAFEAAGFKNVKTLLSSGNVVFDAPKQAASTLQRKCEAAMDKSLDRGFQTVVRSQQELQALIEADPFSAFRLPKDAKRVVTFVRTLPDAIPKLPMESGGARILALRGQDLLTAYVPSDKGAVFMAFIEKTFGKDVTTRTWDTVKKCAAA
jgi:uncharacterized protein (DUF1697 family)